MKSVGLYVQLHAAHSLADGGITPFSSTTSTSEVRLTSSLKHQLNLHGPEQWLKKVILEFDCSQGGTGGCFAATFAPAF